MEAHAKFGKVKAGHVNTCQTEQLNVVQLPNEQHRNARITHEAIVANWRRKIRIISPCALKRRAASDILQKVDKMTVRLHTQVFGIIDGKQCANCCRLYPYN